MTEWSLARLLAGLHDDIEHRLAMTRGTFAHATTKGDASEAVWLELLSSYLPERYRAARAHVVDSKGVFSEQIDVVIYDRQYTPFIFRFEEQVVIPAESVYAVFESKQTVNAAFIGYAQKKVASVRQLYRTTLPIPHAGGVYPAKDLPHILGGVLAFESDWRPALGDPLIKALEADGTAGKLDLGCVAAHGIFHCDDAGCFIIVPEGKPATAFLFELIARLQNIATVPMIDIRAYADWLGR